MHELTDLGRFGQIWDLSCAGRDRLDLAQLDLGHGLCRGLDITYVRLKVNNYIGHRMSNTSRKFTSKEERLSSSTATTRLTVGRQPHL